MDQTLQSQGGVQFTLLDSRIKIRNTCIITKAMVSNRFSYTKRRATTELPKDREIQNYNTYSKQITDCVKDLGVTDTLLGLRTDVPNDQFNIHHGKQ